MSRRESMAPRLRRKREGWVARSGTGPRSPGEAAEACARVPEAPSGPEAPPGVSPSRRGSAIGTGLTTVSTTIRMLCFLLDNDHRISGAGNNIAARPGAALRLPLATFRLPLRGERRSKAVRCPLTTQQLPADERPIPSPPRAAVPRLASGAGRRAACTPG